MLLFLSHLNIIWCALDFVWSNVRLTSIKYKVERDERYLPYIELGLLALQPLSAGNSAEFSQSGNSKTIQTREINLTSLDSLGSCESIYVYLKPQKSVETWIKSL